MTTRQYKDIFIVIDDQPSSRKRSWITNKQIDREYPEVIDKIAEILYDPIYNTRAKDFARSILNFLVLFEFLSWKQFDSILGICRTREEWDSERRKPTQFYRYASCLTVKCRTLHFTMHVDDARPAGLKRNMTDKELDTAYIKIFGHYPVWSEEVEDGLVCKYRNDGSRYFALPMEQDMQLHNHIDYDGYHHIFGRF